MYQVLEQFSDNLVFCTSLSSISNTQGAINPILIEEFKRSNAYFLYLLTEIQVFQELTKLEILYSHLAGSLEEDLKKLLECDFDNASSEEIRNVFGIVSEIDLQEDNLLLIEKLAILRKKLFFDYILFLTLKNSSATDIYNNQTINIDIDPNSGNNTTNGGNTTNGNTTNGNTTNGNTTNGNTTNGNTTNGNTTNGNTTFSKMNDVVVYKLTKISLYSLISILIAIFFLLINKKRVFGKKSFWSQLERSYVVFIYNLIKEQTGIEGIIHLPLIASIFLFILINNLIGLLPFGYTITSHIMITFFLGFSTFLGITILIAINKKEKMIELFIPKGVPKFLIPFLFLIEIISYIFRTVSLSVRLFANMMAGHALLHILSNFGVVILSLKSPSRFFFIFPLLIVFAITFLELGIAILQAYVFAVLLTIYLNDVYAKEGH